VIDGLLDLLTPYLVPVLGGLVGVALLLVLLPWVLAPLLVATGLRLSPPRLSPLGTDRPLPGDAAGQRARLIEELLGLGFRRLTELAADEFLAGSRLELHLLVREGPPHLGATVLTTRIRPGERERTVVDLQLGTRFADGSALVSASSAWASRLLSRPTVQVAYLPGASPSALLRVHLDRLSHEAAAREVVAVPEPEVATCLERDLQADIDHAVALGLLRPVGEGWRPTWSGALRLGWASCWPLSAVLRARERRRATTLILAAQG
jgi:hypothetical protein